MLRNYKELYEPLRVPYGDKVYTLPQVPGPLGLLMLRARLGDEEAAAEIADDHGLTFVKEVLGTAYDEMMADGVPLGVIDRVLLTAIADHNFGRQVAEETWESGRSPEFRAALAAAAKLKSEIAMGAVARTPSPASSSGTSSRRASSGTKRSKPTRSRGKTS